MLPLPTVLERLQRKVPGQVLEVELEQERERWIYEIKPTDACRAVDQGQARCARGRGAACAGPRNRAKIRREAGTIADTLPTPTPPCASPCW